MPIKVIVVVSGGNVQDCFSSFGDVEIEMIDFDNISEEGPDAVKQAEARVEKLADTMHHVY
jgi:hypothetical protein